MSINLSEYSIKTNDAKKRLDWQCMSNFLNSNDFQLLNTATNASISMSISDFNHLNPDGLLLLLITGEYLGSNKNELWLDIPQNRELLTQLKSSEFDKVSSNVFSMDYLLFDSIKIEKIDEAYKYKNVNIQTLKRILHSISDYMSTRKFFTELGINPTSERGFEDIPNFLMVINEICKNIVQHSSGESGLGQGYFIMNKLGKGRLRFTFGDSGHGLMSSLSSKMIKIIDDKEAILEALLYHHIREGEGLFRVVQSVNRLNGYIRIRTGEIEGRLDLTKKYLSSDEETEGYIKKEMILTKSRLSFPGVQYMIDISR